MRATDLVMPALGGARVLVVEAGEDAAASLTAVLRLNGFDAHAARTGRDALAAVATLRPSVVVADLDLPDMTGCEVIRRVRRSVAAPAVVVVTGHTLPERRREAEAAGAAAYLLKPADTSELVRLIQSLSAN